MKAILGKNYIHYKNGHEYTVVAIGKMERNPNEVYVIYRAEYASPDYDGNMTWIRPLQEFEEDVTYNGAVVPRFKLIDA